MKIILAIFISLLTSCTKAPELPLSAEIESIEVSLLGKEKLEGAIAEEHYSTVIKLFQSGIEDDNPPKWKDLGSVIFNLKDNKKIKLYLYETKSTEGAFEINETYYLGEKDDAVIRILKNSIIKEEK